MDDRRPHHGQDVHTRPQTGALLPQLSQSGGQREGTERGPVVALSGVRDELRGGERESLRLKDVHLPRVEQRYTACSFCICVSQIMRLSVADKLLYQQHLAVYHGLQPEIRP